MIISRLKISAFQGAPTQGAELLAEWARQNAQRALLMEAPATGIGSGLMGNFVPALAATAVGFLAIHSFQNMNEEHAGIPEEGIINANGDIIVASNYASDSLDAGVSPPKPCAGVPSETVDTRERDIENMRAVEAKLEVFRQQAELQRLPNESIFEHFARLQKIFHERAIAKAANSAMLNAPLMSAGKAGGGNPIEGATDKEIERAAELDAIQARLAALYAEYKDVVSPTDDQIATFETEVEGIFKATRAMKFRETLADSSIKKILDRIASGLSNIMSIPTSCLGMLDMPEVWTEAIEVIGLTPNQRAGYNVPVPSGNRELHLTLHETLGEPTKLEETLSGTQATWELEARAYSSTILAGELGFPLNPEEPATAALLSGLGLEIVSTETLANGLTRQTLLFTGEARPVADALGAEGTSSALTNVPSNIVVSEKTQAALDTARTVYTVAQDYIEAGQAELAIPLITACINSLNRTLGETLAAEEQALLSDAIASFQTLLQRTNNSAAPKVDISQALEKFSTVLDLLQTFINPLHPTGLKQQLTQLYASYETSEMLSASTFEPVIHNAQYYPNRIAIPPLERLRAIPNSDLAGVGELARQIDIVLSRFAQLAENMQQVLQDAKVLYGSIFFGNNAFTTWLNLFRRITDAETEIAGIITAAKAQAAKLLTTLP